jgi:hypothetical protein
VGVTTGAEVDTGRSASERTYPTFGPGDDDFHDEVMTDRWWETETCWFSWNVPERHMSGWAYGQARPNARLCNGGVWVWDDRASATWELPYHVHYSGLQLPDRSERDLRDFEWPTGVRVTARVPLTTYDIAYHDPGALEVDLRFEAIMPPNPHPVGVVPFVKGTHFDQPGRVTGEMVLAGERIAVDCLSFRDRSWGPRPMGRPKPRAEGTIETASRFGGVGYCFGAAGPGDAWLAYSTPGIDGDPVVCGFLLRDGTYGHVTGSAHPPRDRRRRRPRSHPRGQRRVGQPSLAGPRRRLPVPVVVGRTPGPRGGPELLQPRRVGSQPVADVTGPVTSVAPGTCTGSPGSDHGR